MPEKHIKYAEFQGDKLKYLLQMPRLKSQPAADTKYPLFVSLHGSGGHSQIDDIEKGERDSLLIEYVDKEFDYPFIVIAPRMPTNEEGRYTCRGWIGICELVKQMIDDVIETYPVDTDRIYLGGFSMGGMGTWSISMKYPEYFAALVVAAGRGNPDELHKIKKIPVWVFQGRQDDLILYKDAKAMVDRLFELGADVTFTIFPGEHVIEASIFAEGTMRWLLSHSKSANELKWSKVEKKRAELKQRLESRPKAKVMKGTPVIGKADEAAWDRCEIMSTDNCLLGKDVARAEFKVLWDENFFYIKAFVYDNTMTVQEELQKCKNSPQGLFYYLQEADCIEIFLDMDNDGNTVYGEHCDQYRITSGNNLKITHAQKESERVLKSVAYFEKGYIVEAAIPYPGGARAKAGMTIGFDVQVNDNMGNGKREGIRTWSDVTGNAWSDPSVFGDITLVLDNKINF